MSRVADVAMSIRGQRNVSGIARVPSVVMLARPVDVDGTAGADMFAAGRADVTVAAGADMSLRAALPCPPCPGRMSAHDVRASAPRRDFPRPGEDSVVSAHVGRRETVAAVY